MTFKKYSYGIHLYMFSFPTPAFLDLFCKIIITDIICNIRKISSTMIQPVPIK